MEQVLRDSPATIELPHYDRDGELLPGVAGITAAIVDPAGAAIAGSPFAATEVSDQPGWYRVVTGVLSTLGVYRVTWNLAAGQKRYSEFEVVGAFLFELADLRRLDPVLQDPEKFPASLLREARTEITDRFEEVANVSFIPRATTETLDGDGTTWLLLSKLFPKRVISGSVGGTALAAGDVADLRVYPHGAVLRQTLGTWAAGTRNVVLTYEHGFERPPIAVSRAAMQVCRAALLEGPLDAKGRATAVFTEQGGYRITIAGRDGPFGLPDVDAVLEQFGHKRFGVA